MIIRAVLLCSMVRIHFARLFGWTVNGSRCDTMGKLRKKIMIQWFSKRKSRSFRRKVLSDQRAYYSFPLILTTLPAPSSVAGYTPAKKTYTLQKFYLLLNNDFLCMRSMNSCCKIPLHVKYVPTYHTDHTWKWSIIIYNKNHEASNRVWRKPWNRKAPRPNEEDHGFWSLRLDIICIVGIRHIAHHFIHIYTQWAAKEVTILFLGSGTRRSESRFLLLVRSKTGSSLSFFRIAHHEGH